jgi:hypothetical protein
MYDRFTQRVRQIMLLAAQEAMRLRHDQIRTEHMLLGLLKHGDGVAATALANLHCDFTAIAREVVGRIHTGISKPLEDLLPRAECAERALQHAVDEARNMDSNYVGTEHLLLGLLRAQDGIASQVLAGCGLRLEEVRAEIARLVPQPGAEQKQPLSAGSIAPLDDADRRLFLSLYRQAVAFYQPKIEKRTGIRLGGISVCDCEELHHHVWDDMEGRYLWSIRVLRAIFLRQRLQLRYQQCVAALAERTRKCIAMYYGGAIYISFSGNKFHEDVIAYITIHELAHALWERLEEVPLHAERLGIRRLMRDEREKFNLLVEGYASYAERVWFLDLYPPPARDVLRHSYVDPKSINGQGLRRVRALVKEHGSDVLLDLPKRWRSY